MTISNFTKVIMRNPAISLIVFLLIINSCLCSPAKGQKEFGFKMPPKMKSVKIPFEQHNNLIVIPLTVNRFLTLKFILDTGVETAILTEKLFADILELNYVRKIHISGPGIVDSVEAIVASEATFSLPGGLVGQNMNMLVLEEDYLKLSESIGDEVHGIIGYDIFSKFVVEINYDDKVLYLHNPNRYKAPKRATKIPLSITKSKPFIRADLHQDGQNEHLDFMIDTGASHAALIDYNNIPTLDLPEEKIETRLGRGIAGEILGYLGRMDSLAIADFDFNKVIVSAPFQGAYNKVIKRGARIGTFGGELLTRFNVTFDYKNQSLYLIRGKKYSQDFEHDMSGLTINAMGENLDTLSVIAVEDESPAKAIGIEEGDMILSINGKSLKSHDLSTIYALLRSRDGRKIRVKLLRDGNKIVKRFRLKRKI